MSVFMVFHATCLVIESKETHPIAARHVVFVDIKRTSKSVYQFQSLPYKSLVRKRKKKKKISSAVRSRAFLLKIANNAVREEGGASESKKKAARIS